nr:hypothetical protein [Gemmatimonadales bacterium]
MIGFALLLQLGAAGPPAPTVGDTVWLGRTVAIPRGATVRPADWEPTDPVESLGPPRVTLRGDSADIAYPVAIWRAGTELVSLPGPLLLGANGTVDSVEPVEVPVTVASVLPPTPSDSVLAPQPRAAVVPRGVRSVLPVLVA